MSINTLPKLNDANANEYFKTIESDAIAYENLSSDMINNFLGAIESRFVITNSQRIYIESFTSQQKEAIVCSVKTMADYLREDHYEGKKVVPMIQGLSEQPPQPVNNISVKAGAKVEKDFQTGATKGPLFIEISC